ncbi:MAG: nucleotide exchange factor GrpE [Chloroflexi bacterium]|nr:nucleotide exchange factor GrpE [Chloroflexota bacterium]
MSVVSESAPRPSPESPDHACGVDELQNQILRLQADLENLRRRSERRRQEAVAGARQELLSGLLPVLDNLERALQAAADPDDQLAVGIGMVRTQLLETLGRAGLEAVPAAGHFDPRLHEVVACLPSDEVDEGQIVAVVRTGYRADGVVLRPAQVQVAGPPQQGGT